MDKTAYRPEESGEIHAYFHTGSFNGPVSKNIRVYSNSVGSEVIRISLQATVQSDLKPATTSLYFRDAVPGKTEIKKVLIENTMDMPLEIRDVKLEGSRTTLKQFPVAVELDRGEDGREFLLFSMTPNPDMKLMERGNLTVAVTTNSPKNPTLRFYAIVKMQKPVEIQPATLFLYGIHPGRARSRRIQLTSHVGRLTDVKIQYEGKFLSFEKVRESEDLVHVWVGSRTDAPAGTFNDLVRIHLKAAGTERTFTVPVRGSIIHGNPQRSRTP